MCVVFSENPFAAGQIHGHDMLVLHKGDAVFRLLVNLYLRVIRTHVAFSAWFRTSGHFRGKVVSRMAGAARSPRAVNIDSADTGIGPAVRGEARSFAVDGRFGYTNGAAVALLTAAIGGGRAFGVPT